MAMMTPRLLVALGMLWVVTAAFAHRILPRVPLPRVPLPRVPLPHVPLPHVSLPSGRGFEPSRSEVRVEERPSYYYHDTSETSHNRGSYNNQEDLNTIIDDDDYYRPSTYFSRYPLTTDSPKPSDDSSRNGYDNTAAVVPTESVNSILSDFMAKSYDPEQVVTRDEDVKNVVKKLFDAYRSKYTTVASVDPEMIKGSTPKVDEVQDSMLGIGRTEHNKFINNLRKFVSHRRKEVTTEASIIEGDTSSVDEQLDSPKLTKLGQDRGTLNLTDPVKWEQSTWTFIRSQLINFNNATRGHERTNEWFLFNQTDPLLKRWRIVIISRPAVMVKGNIRSVGLPQNLWKPDTVLKILLTEPSTWNFDDNATRVTQSEQSAWKFLFKTQLKSKNTTCGGNYYDVLVFNQTDPLLKHQRLVVTTRPIKFTENIPSVAVQQNSSELNYQLGENGERVEPTETVSPKMQSTLTFIRRQLMKPYNSTRGLVQNEWFKFNQTDPLLKRWRIVAISRPAVIVKEYIQSVGVSQNLSVLDTGIKILLSDPSTWNFDDNATRVTQSDQSAWTFFYKLRLKSKNPACIGKHYDVLVFNQIDPFLKLMKMVTISTPVKFKENIPSLVVQQNSKGPNNGLGEDFKRVEPTETIPPRREPSTRNLVDNDSRSTESELDRST